MCTMTERKYPRIQQSIPWNHFDTLNWKKKILGSVINLPEKKTSLEAANLGDLAAHKTQEPTKTLRI